MMLSKKITILGGEESKEEEGSIPGWLQYMFAASVKRKI